MLASHPSWLFLLPRANSGSGSSSCGGPCHSSPLRILRTPAFFFSPDTGHEQFCVVPFLVPVLMSGFIYARDAAKPSGRVFWVNISTSRVSKDHSRRHLVRCLRSTSPNSDAPSSPLSLPLLSSCFRSGQFLGGTALLLVSLPQSPRTNRVRRHRNSLYGICEPFSTLHSRQSFANEIACVGRKGRKGWRASSR